MRNFVMLFLICLLFPFAALAKEDRAVRECRKLIEKETAPYWELLREMADFKAAIDAGYEGCAQTYPDEFEGAEDISAYWKDNTATEYNQAFEVVDVLVDESFKTINDKDCDGKDALVDELKEKSREVIDGQYEKAHQRRVKALVGDGLSGTGENSFLDYNENDSCKHVLTTLETYRKYHGSKEQAQFALFTFATKHSGMSNRMTRETKKAVQAFDKQRKTITFSAFGN